MIFYFRIHKVGMLILFCLRRVKWVHSDRSPGTEPYTQHSVTPNSFPAVILCFRRGKRASPSQLWGALMLCGDPSALLLWEPQWDAGNVAPRPAGGGGGGSAAAGTSGRRSQRWRSTETRWAGSSLGTTLTLVLTCSHNLAQLADEETSG